MVWGMSDTPPETTPAEDPAGTAADAPAGGPAGAANPVEDPDFDALARDIAEVPAVEETPAA